MERFKFRRFAALALILVFSVAYSEVAAQQNTTDKPNETQTLLETVGTLTAANLYLSYLSLAGTFASIESLSKESELRDLVAPVETSARLTKSGLKRILEECSVGEEDRKALMEMDSICTLIESACAKLLDYGSGKSPADRDAFANEHDKIGLALERIFGKNEEADE